MKSWVVVDVFKEIAEKVSDKLTFELNLLDQSITGIHYEHGHIREIVTTLTEKDQIQLTNKDRYPLIALIQDFPERVSDLPGIQSEVSLQIIIAKATEPTYKASERYTENFNPFLYPIYQELLNQIWLHPATVLRGPSQIQHTKIDRVFWGREGVYGSESNIFNDWIDCIEIRDMRIRINTKLC